MSKYNSTPLKPHDARKKHTCSLCRKEINPGEKVFYQSEKFLQSLNSEKFCKQCFDNHGQELLEIENKDQKNLENF